jgi:soluble cytochrome b562
MAKPGRNDRCPCGSGKKYKACCLTRDEAAERDRLAAEQAGREARTEARRLEQRKARDAIVASFVGSPDDGDDLEETVDAALRFIDEGKLEEIETAARHLIERYPDIRTDGSSSAMSTRSAAKTERPSPAIVVCWKSSTARRTTSTRSTRSAS